MGRPSNRETILEKGIGVLRKKGYTGSSVREISDAAGVPLGSFTNHFASKEDFTLEVLNIYFQKSSETVARTLLNEGLTPLKRLQAFINGTEDALNCDQEWNGCLVANLSIEASAHSEKIRKRLAEISRSLEKSVGSAIKAAVKCGELPKTTDVETLAAFLVFAQHGAYLQAKVDREAKPIRQLKKVLFEYLLPTEKR